MRGQFFGRAAHDVHAQLIVQFGLHIGLLEGFDDFGVELLHDGLGCALGGVDGLPRRHLEARHARLDHGGQLGREGDALAGCDGQQLHAAGLGQGQSGGHLVEHEGHLAGSHVGQRGWRALVGDVGELHANQVAKHFACQVGGGACARGREHALGRVFLEQRNQLGHAVHAQRGVDDEHVGQRGHQGHGLKVLDRVVRQVLVQAGVDGVRADGAAKQRVAIGRRLGHKRCANAARLAGLVLDHHSLFQRLLQLVGDGAANDVGGATGGEGHHVADGLGIGPVARLGMGLGGRQCAQCGQQRCSAQSQRGAAQWVVKG